MVEQQLSSPEKYVVKRSKASFTSGERRIILHVYGVLRIENPGMTKREVEICKIRKGIKGKVHSLYRQNIPPTVKKVTQMINEDPDLPNVSVHTTRKLLHDLGFKYEKRERRSILIEREDIVRWRRSYLQDIKTFRTEERKIFYLDETWCNAGHTVKKAWTPKYIISSREAFMSGETTGLRDVPGRGGRHIVVHIGSEDGFLRDPTDPSAGSDARCVFRAKKTAKIANATHHDEMNAKAFEDWFTGVLHVLPPNSVIVMDNASYHSETLYKLLNMSWKKGEIQEWLNAKVKNEVARTNTDYSLHSVEALLNNALDNVSDEDWRKAVKHVMGVEDLMWDLEAMSNDVQDNFIINLAEDSESEDGSEVGSDGERHDTEDDSGDDLAVPL
ncbi:uncharacterized protein LOC128984106 [Macrosteles quadrilineatus]|uniref:uncharacterized protein LOC128984106 n=1 Tax=Macrosteles quadrilineatus TaxID=74068 RepID=UPI0023E274A8|nr:uncharacterized protein LOC128984106 [Macrosteles quadrilineatus]